MSESTKFHVVLFQPEIPQNTGAVGRTCLAVAAKLWLVRPLGFRVDQRSLKRAGLDYWKDVQWEVVSDWQSLLARLAGHRFWYFSKSACRLYTDAEFRTGDVMVFGSETRGLPKPMLDENARCSLRIPIQSPVRSLNLSNAVAVSVYEALRQTSANGMLQDPT